MKTDVHLRPIKKSDDAVLAQIIRRTLVEFKANKPGTVYFDAATDHLSSCFELKKAAYFVIVENGNIAGGAGFFPTDGLPEDTCELVKMYLLPAYRGKGYGHILINKCITMAALQGFRYMYLETMPELIRAIDLYQRIGFQFIDKPLGNSGHTGCDIWMLKQLPDCLQ